LLLFLENLGNFSLEISKILLNLVSIFLCKLLWKFNMKNEYNEILNNWKMISQALDDKWRYFLDLLDNNLNSIEPTYSKGLLWLKFLGHSNLLYIRATRIITNHASIEEYWLRFFPWEEFWCPCLIETKYHIFHKYNRFNNY